MRVTITLQSNEKEALRRLAESERRDPRAQAALLTHQELARRGLLPGDTDRPAHQGQAGGGDGR